MIYVLDVLAAVFISELSRSVRFRAWIVTVGYVILSRSLIALA